MKVTKIGDILLDNPLFIKEEFNFRNAKAKVFNTIGGGLIVYETPKRDNTNYITLISKDSGWIRKETLAQIKELLDDLNVEVEIETDKGIKYNVRPALEKEVIKVIEDVANENSGWVKVEISLCEV